MCANTGYWLGFNASNYLLIGNERTVRRSQENNEVSGINSAISSFIFYDLGGMIQIVLNVLGLIMKNMIDLTRIVTF